jgi:hypothetical protein
VNTFFRLTAGVGSSTNYDQPIVINGNEVKALTGQITFAALNVQYQQKINNWLAFSVAADMKGNLGSQTISLLTQGINIASTFNIGWLFNAIETKKFILSPSLLIANQSLSVFSLDEFIEKIIQNGGITQSARLVRATNVTAGFAGIRTAYAFNRTFGCIGDLNLGYGESISSNADKGYFGAGLSFDADLDPKYKVPIGFTLGYNWNNFSNGDVSIKNPQNAMFKISYTGKKDFDLGVEMNAQFFTFTPGKEQINLQVVFMRAAIAYYF